MRDHNFRRSANIGSVRELGALYRSAHDIRNDARSVGRDAADYLAGHPWWMHVDLDVLDPAALPATLVPGETEQEPGGLNWDELTHLMTTAASHGGCRGLSIAIYDPGQDTSFDYPARIVALIHEVLESARPHR